MFKYYIEIPLITHKISKKHVKSHNFIIIIILYSYLLTIILTLKLILYNIIVSSVSRVKCRVLFMLNTYKPY